MAETKQEGPIECDRGNDTKHDIKKEIHNCSKEGIQKLSHDINNHPKKLVEINMLLIPKTLKIDKDGYII